MKNICMTQFLKIAGKYDCILHTPIFFENFSPGVDRSVPSGTPFCGILSRACVSTAANGTDFISNGVSDAFNVY